MARRSFTDLLNDANPDYFKDQGKPGTWVADQITLIRDFMDTLQPGYAIFLIEGDQTQTFDETPAVVTAWTLAPIVTPEFDADLGTGIITAKIPMVLQISVNLTLEFAVNGECVAKVDRAGAGGAAQYTGSVQGRGAGKPVGLSINAIFDITDPPDSFDLEIASESGSGLYTFKTGAMICQLVPIINTPT